MVVSRTVHRLIREHRKIRKSLAGTCERVLAGLRERRLLKQPVSRLSPALASFFLPDARMEHIAGGFHFTEGPLWIPDERTLLFSDIPANSIYRAAPE